MSDQSMAMAETKTYRYERVIEQVIDLICEHGLEIGDRLPAERELADRFDCNYLTIRKAIALMIERQILERRRGSGTYLRTPVNRLSLGKAPKVTFFPLNLLALIVLSNPEHFQMQLLNSITTVCATHGVELVVHPLTAFDNASLTLPAQLKQHGCKAIMIAGVPSADDTSQFREFVSRCEIPVVLSASYPGLEHLIYGRPAESDLFPRREMRFAVKYFAALGYEHIFYLTSQLPAAHLSGVKQQEYLRLMRELGRTAHLEFLARDFAGIEELTVRLAACCGHAAVICFDDDYALRLMTALYKRGFSIPGDFALFGCNDADTSGFAEPPLTTFRFPYVYVAESFIFEALSRADETRRRELTLPPIAPVIRGSCGGEKRLGVRLQTTIQQITQEVYREIPVP